MCNYNKNFLRLYAMHDMRLKNVTWSMPMLGDAITLKSYTTLPHEYNLRLPCSSAKLLGWYVTKMNTRCYQASKMQKTNVDTGCAHNDSPYFE